MAKSIKNRVFGASVPVWVKDKIRIRQALAKSGTNPMDPITGDSIGVLNKKEYNFDGEADLSSRTPVARMWTALSFFKDIDQNGAELSTEDEINSWWANRYESSGDTKDTTYLKDMTNGVFKEFKWEQIDSDFQKIYVIGNHVLNTEEINIQSPIEDENSKLDPSAVKEFLPGEQQTDMNQYLKPASGITSIKSETEGTLGALKKTTVSFIVHNFSDFEKIYLKYFMKPGVQVFVDFGWDTGLLYNPSDLLKDINYNDFLYGETGMVTNSKGDLETLFGYVINYDASVREDGGFDCSVEIISKNASLLGDEIDPNTTDRIVKSLDIEILKLGMAGVTGDASFYFDSLRSGAESDTIEEYNQELMKAAIDAFGGLGVTLPGTEKSKLPSRYGIFVFSPDGFNGVKKTYLNFGWVEDNILNKQLGFSDDSANLTNSTKDSNIIDDNHFMSKFNSKNSFITYNEFLMFRMRAMEQGLEFIYPETYGSLGSTYNSEIGMTPDRFDESDNPISTAIDDTNSFKEFEKSDREEGKIPLREIFISTDMVKSSIKNATNPGQFLTNIIKKINSESGDYIELGLVSNSYARHSLAITDKSLQVGDMSNKDIFFEGLLEFNPYTSNTIVKSYDLQFTMPQGGLGNMIAIQGSTNPANIIPINKLVDSLVNFEIATNPSDTYIRTLPLTGLNASNRLVAKSETDTSNLFGFSEDDLFFGKDDEDKSQRKNELMKRLTQTNEGNPEKLYKEHIQNTKTNLQKLIGVSILNSGSKADPVDPSSDKIKNIDFAEESRNRAQKFKYKLVNTTDQYYEKQFEMDTSLKTAFLVPVEAGLTFYGISGLTPGDLIRISYLPKHYYDNTYWQVTKVSHDVGDTWDTSLELQMRIFPSKERQKNESKLMIKKTYLQEISKGGLTNIEILLPFIGDLSPILLDTEEKTPNAMSRIVFRSEIIRVPTTIQQAPGMEYQLALPPIPAYTDEEDNFKKAQVALSNAFPNVSGDKKLDIRFEYNPELDSIPMDLSYLGLGDWTWKFQKETAYFNTFISEMKEGAELYIVRSGAAWLIVSTSPQTLDKWQVLDTFFQIAAAIPIKNPTFTDTTHTEQDTLLDDIGDLTDTVTKAASDFIKNASETGIWQKAKDFFSW